MDFIGKVIFIGQKRSGTSSSGKAWATQDFVVEDSSSRFPRKLCFSVFGEERLQQFNIQMGEMLSVSFDVDAHEYQGRWFNNITAFGVQHMTTAQPQQSATMPGTPGSAFGPVPPAPTSNPSTNTEDGGLPF